MGNKDLVAHFIIRGRPVASAHKNRVSSVNGRAMLHPTKEWKLWFSSAWHQVEKTLKRGGHDVVFEPVIVKRGKNVGKPGKNSHGETVNPKNPLFTGGIYRIVVYYFYPKKVYKRNPDGSVKTTFKRKENVPVTNDFQPLDIGNVAKGVVDALQQGGAIDNDRYEAVEMSVDCPFLEDDAEPYVAVEVTYFDYDDPKSWVLPWPCPIVPVDPRLFMPRVFSGGHDWHVFRKQEAAFKEVLKAQGEAVDKDPVAKCRCRRCTCLIGDGYPASEIWWDYDEERWGKEVVLVCSECGANAAEHKPKFLAEWDRQTLIVCQRNGVPLTEAPAHEDPHYPMYNLIRRKVREVLINQYRETYCLVPAEQIATVSWLEIDRLNTEKQVEIFGPVKEKTSDRAQPRHQQRRHRGDDLFDAPGESQAESAARSRRSIDRTAQSRSEISRRPYYPHRGRREGSQSRDT